MKRILLFVGTNIAIIAVIMAILSIFNVQPYLTQHGINYQALLIFAAIVGFAGAFISLLISKFIAKHTYNIRILGDETDPGARWIKQTTERLATQAGIGLPEVGIYQSPEPNAFATGWNRNNALVAVSTGLLQAMSQDEIEGVLGHEVSHIANGDMVTMSLIQGVINTFVIFFARIAAFFVMQFFQRGNDGDSAVGGFTYYLVAIVFEIFFGILASIIVMWFSRIREFRADAGSARLCGRGKMVSALEKLAALQNAPEDKRGASLATLKISGHKGIMALFASHPPIEKRIQALKGRS